MIKDKFLKGLLAICTFITIAYVALFFAVSCKRTYQIQNVDINKVSRAKVIILDSCEYLIFDKYTGITHKGNCKNH